MIWHNFEGISWSFRVQTNIDIFLTIHIVRKVLHPQNYQFKGINMSDILSGSEYPHYFWKFPKINQLIESVQSNYCVPEKSCSGYSWL